MIKPNELRINNWISHNNNYVQVFELPYLIDLDENKEAYLVNSIWIDEYRPIPITPEILEKCGFVKHDLGYETWRKEGFTEEAGFTDRYSKWIDLVRATLVITSTPYDEVEAVCESLHQLQNLYFALTGEELTFKP